MAMHERFKFKTKEEFLTRCRELGVNMPFSEDMTVFHQSVQIGSFTAPNRIAILPMEGCDSLPDGSPSELVQRRYNRFYAGGAGLVWWEANAVVAEGKANELQMMITKDNVDSFTQLIKKLKKDAISLNGYAPIAILQLTHSGRYSRPVGHQGSPIITQHDPVLDSRMHIEADYPVCSDDYLSSLVDRYVQSALLAKEAGFDGVDIKACHRYLLSELLASHTRQGNYGGSYKNRVRLLLDIIQAVKHSCGDSFIIACRFNIFDAHPYPYGFGNKSSDIWEFDETEPIQLVKDLVESGVSLLSNSAGNPYYMYPQVTRPFDHSSEGIPIPNEHPLESIERLFGLTKLIQQHAGKIPVVGNGYSWLRQFMPEVGSANLQAGNCQFMGLGRSAFAYPDTPNDILKKGYLEPNKCCTTCSKCTQIMRDHGRTGCVIRDSKVYAPLYSEAKKNADARRTI